MKVESEKKSNDITVYAQNPNEVDFAQLQINLQNCLAIVDNQVMKDYVPMLHCCPIVKLDTDLIKKGRAGLGNIQFFRITELVYQEEEFSVHKLSTVFNALSNKPCSLVLMIQSDGQTNNFYLGVRSGRDYSTGTMKQLLERSLLGTFPGSNTESYMQEQQEADFDNIKCGAVSSVTCIADYKQKKESYENKDFVQGIEKLIYSMQGKEFTAICIANNLQHQELVEKRKEYERIYTLLSPFASMQYNYALNQSSGVTESDTKGHSLADSSGSSFARTFTEGRASALQQGRNVAKTDTDTEGRTLSDSRGKTHSDSTSEGKSETRTDTASVARSKGKSLNCGINMGSVNVGGGSYSSYTGSVSRGWTYGTSCNHSISEAVSETLTRSTNVSKSVGNTIGESQAQTQSKTIGSGKQYVINQGHTVSNNSAYTKALAQSTGNSQAVTLNVQNKSLTDLLKRLDKQLERFNECESIGMWDFAAYFLGESAAETEAAANMYRSLVSGKQSGLEAAAVNTWTYKEDVKNILKYIENFMHPVFHYELEIDHMIQQVLVDPTALVSTNELAIQMGLPRKSVKGLPVVDHAFFAQEVLCKDRAENQSTGIALGKVNYLGKETKTKVNLDLQSLTMHTFITGSTGAGKSNTIYQILSQLRKKNVNFLVVEPAKGEYRNVFGNDSAVKVYGTNPLLGEVLRINPFSFPKTIHIYEHLDRLIEIFNVCWPMYAAMPAVLKEAVERAYIKAGWNLKNSSNKYSDELFPSFLDVLEQINIVVEQSQYSNDNKSDYKGALCTRIRSLTNGINGLIFTSDALSAAKLFDENVIVDLSRIGSLETKSLIMGILVMQLQEHRMDSCKQMNASLNHVTVLEEAHNLLKRVSTEQSTEQSNLIGKSVEMLTNAIAEMRTYGEGFIIADQSPGLLDIAAIRNTNTKIIMRLPEYSDCELVGRSVGLKEKQIAELSKLHKGVAVVYQNDWLEATLCNVHKYIPERSHASLCVPRKYEERIDIKSKIISRLVTKKVYNLVDQTDYDAILRADLSVTVKMKLFQYIQLPVNKRMDCAAAITYELFEAQAVCSVIEKYNLSYEQQKTFLCEKLSPSLLPMPDKYAEIILCLVVYHHVKITSNPSMKLLLDQIIEQIERRESWDD